MSKLITFLVFTGGGYLINITYISVFYHRALAHGSLELSPTLRRIVLQTGIWATGIDPKGWVCMHRLHHMHSDTVLDPHSPAYSGVLGAARMQLRSYEMVLAGLAHGRREMTSIVSDIESSVSCLNRYRIWAVPYLLHMAIGVAIGIWFDSWLVGLGYFSGIMSHPFQAWMVNALGHSYGYRNFDTSDNSRNNTIVAWAFMGEGFQNNHHYMPQSAKLSSKWWEIDTGYLICLGLNALGLVRIRKLEN